MALARADCLLHRARGEAEDEASRPKRRWTPAQAADARTSAACSAQSAHAAFGAAACDDSDCDRLPQHETYLDKLVEENCSQLACLYSLVQLLVKAHFVMREHHQKLKRDHEALEQRLVSHQLLRPHDLFAKSVFGNAAVGQGVMTCLGVESLRDLEATSPTVGSMMTQSLAEVFDAFGGQQLQPQHFQQPQQPQQQQQQQQQQWQPQQPPLQQVLSSPPPQQQQQQQQQWPRKGAAPSKPRRSGGVRHLVKAAAALVDDSEPPAPVVPPSPRRDSWCPSIDDSIEEPAGESLLTPPLAEPKVPCLQFRFVPRLRGFSDLLQVRNVERSTSSSEYTSGTADPRGRSGRRSTSSSSEAVDGMAEPGGGNDLAQGFVGDDHGSHPADAPSRMRSTTSCSSSEHSYGITTRLVDDVHRAVDTQSEYSEASGIWTGERSPGSSMRGARHRNLGQRGGLAHRFRAFSAALAAGRDSGAGPRDVPLDIAIYEGGCDEQGALAAWDSRERAADSDAAGSSAVSSERRGDRPGAAAWAACDDAKLEEVTNSSEEVTNSSETSSSQLSTERQGADEGGQLHQGTRSQPSLTPGRLVRLHSLKLAPELNGSLGTTVVRDPVSGSWHVELFDGCICHLKPRHLRPLSPAP